MDSKSQGSPEAYTPQGEGPRIGERVVFWSWMSLIAVGLAIMIVVPLTGR